MKAIRFHRYGRPDVLRLERVETPRPRRQQVLVKVVATSVNPKDCMIRSGKFRWLTGRRFPKILGNDLAGEIVEVGRSVRHLAPGDRVFGMVNAATGATYAEYVAVSANEIAPAPESIDLRDAAGIPLVGLTALQALRDVGGIRADHRVCINGASGGVGTAAIQIAKAFGTHVTAVCSARNEGLCMRLGADEVVPYDVRNVLEGAPSFDIFFDVFGNFRFGATVRAIRDGGCFVGAVPSKDLLLSVLRTIRAPKRARIVVVRSKQADLELLAKLVRQRKLVPVTDEVMPLEDAARAHEYVQTKRVRGKVILSVA